MKNYFSSVSWLPKQKIARRPVQPTLLEMIEESRQAWKNALREFNLGDREVADYLIYKVNAAERRYMVLLKQARAGGVTAWPGEQLAPAIAGSLNNAESGERDQ
ncbi:MAG: DUF2508 family protein [Desulfotomaculales bacterium]